MKGLNLSKIKLPKVNFSALWHGARAFEATYRPQILTGTAIATMWASIAITYQVSPKIHEIVDDCKEKLNNIPNENTQARNAVKKDAVVGIAKQAVLPVAGGAISTAAMICSTSVSAKRLAAVSSVLASSEAHLDMYKKYIRENMGDKKEQEVKDQIAKKDIKSNPETEDTPVYITGNGDVKFYDPWPGRYFWSSPEAVRKAFVELSYQCQMEDYVTLNDLYYKLNLPETKSGDILGWTTDSRKKGCIDITFSALLDEKDRPVDVLEYDIEVLPYYREARRIGFND